MKLQTTLQRRGDDLSVFRFQIIFLCSTGGGESWHQPRPGLRLWDRSDQQACPVTSFQERGTGGYDGEFPG